MPFELARGRVNAGLRQFPRASGVRERAVLDDGAQRFEVGRSHEPADVQESLAIAFAELAKEDHRSIGPAMFATLREEFTDEQIVELCAWVCFKIGSNMLGAILGLDPSTEEQRREYEAMLAERAAATA